MNDVIVRELKYKDLDNGYIETLSELSDIITSKNELDKIYSFFVHQPNYYFFVAEYNEEIIGCVTLFIERKFIHNGGKSGHIEDVVVRKKYRDGDIGSRLVSKLIEKAKEVGCYKVVLDCGCDVAPFYDKLGFIGEKVMYKIKFEKQL